MSNSMPIVNDCLLPMEAFPYVQSDASVHQAVAALLKQTASDGKTLVFDEILVINQQNIYVGRLTVRGIVSCYFPTLFPADTNAVFAGKKEKFTDLAILLEDNFQTECKRQGDLPISQFMEAPIKAVKSDTHLLHAAEILIANNWNYLPVVENQEVLGIVRLVDIFRTLAGCCSL